MLHRQRRSKHSSVLYGSIWTAFQDLEYDENMILKFMNFTVLGKEQINIICEKTINTPRAK